jgi:hypothetical protein
VAKGFRVAIVLDDASRKVSKVIVLPNPRKKDSD